jgi:hypothetical protein
MKINFRKIVSVLAGAVMLGSTIGMAAAANYPAPFVQGGVADVAIVYGASANVLDSAQAGIIQSNLQLQLAQQTATSGTGTSATGTGGDITSLNSGSDLLYLNDELNENVQTLTKDDLSTVLADGTFTDDNGVDYKYEQTITVGSGATFAFSNSDNDLTDPALILALPTSTGSPMYTLTTTFDDAVPFNATASEGETISLFGKTYTIGTATDTDTLVLLGGSAAQIINVGETKTLTVNGVSYEVTLNGISSDTTPKASISVNGDSKTYTELQTKEVADDVDLFAKTVFRTGDNTGHVEIEIGADKLSFETASAVMRGSENTEIDGTLATIAGGIGAMTKLTIAIVAPDNDANDILVGGAFTDPVFGTVKVQFQDVANGPIIVDKQDTSTTRNEISITKGGDRELLVTATDSAGNKKTIPFTYQDVTQDDSGNDIELIEGANLTDDEYFILDSGNYQHFMQMTKVDADSSGQVTFKDLFTGTSYGTSTGTDHTTAQTVTISNQVYTIREVNGDSTVVNITTSDIATNTAVYPYIELVAGEDHRFAYTDYVQVFTGATATSDRALDLPTGTVNVAFADSGATLGDCVITFSGTGITTTTLAVNGTAIAATGIEDTVTVGSVDYVFWANETGTLNTVCTTVNVMIGIESTQNATGDVQYNAPGLLFMEDQDKSEATTTTENAVILKTSDDASYSTVAAPVFTGTSDTESFDNSDFTGYVTNFGTYVLRDASDDHQAFASLTYPKNQMYADVYFAEASASIAGGAAGGTVATLGNVMVTDSQISTVQTKNLIVVGGSCINTVAARVLGSNTPLCGAAFTTASGKGAGQYLLKVYASPYTTGKIALLVAGYEKEETAQATTALTTTTTSTSVA